MLQATYPGVSIHRGIYLTPQKKSLDFATLFISFYGDEEYFVLLHSFNEAKQNTLLKSNLEYLRAIKSYFDTGGVKLYILNFSLQNAIEVETITKFMKDNCDNLNDLEIICTIGLIKDPQKDLNFSENEVIKAIHAINSYALDTDRISITDINTTIKENYLDQLGETVIYHPWFIDSENELIPPSVIAAALSSKLAYDGLFFNSIANKPIPNLKKLSNDFSNYENSELYSDGINPITFINKQGLKIWGVKAFNSHYESVNEMRILKYIKRQLKRLSREYIFETNTEELNSRLYIDVTQFLLGLWQIGALSGNSKQEAFEVIGDIQNLDSNRNQLTFTISVAISKPLEFIIIKLNRINYDGVQESLSVES